MDIYKIVLTGGPCAGKTTVIEFVKEKLIKDGYYVIVVPETAAELIRNGIKPNDDRNHTLRFQELVLETQARKEKIAEAYCEFIKNTNIEEIKKCKGIVVLYDRGIMDNRAYLSYEDYNNMLKKYNYNELELIDKYDLVINLISLATTNPELYCLDEVRYETPEEAARRDMITSGAWLLHRNLKLVKPTKDVKDKANIVLGHIYDLIEKKRKDEMVQFEIDKDKTDLSCYGNDNSKKIKITTFNLRTLDNTNFILDKREYGGNVSFIINDINEKTNKPITQQQYDKLIHSATITVEKCQDILHIIDNGNYYKIIEDGNILMLHVHHNNVLEIPKNIVLKK